MSSQPPVPEQPPVAVEPVNPVAPQPTPPKRPNSVGVAALVVGIVAVVVGIIPFLGVIAFLLGPVAIILGIVGILLKSRTRTTAIVGLVLGVISLILSGIISSALATGASSATDAPAPTVPPAVGSSSAASDNPDGATNERGNIVRTVGQGAGLADESGKQAVSFVVTKITADPKCTGQYPRPAVNGHYLALNISAQGYAPLKTLFGSGTFDFNAANWKLIAANGTTFNGDLNSGPALGCLPDAQQLPDRVGVGEKITGTLILDVPATKGTLVFAPTFADKSWEWQYPAK
jgi:hypothetical protein